MVQVQITNVIRSRPFIRQLLSSVHLSRMSDTLISFPSTREGLRYVASLLLKEVHRRWRGESRRSPPPYGRDGRQQPQDVRWPRQRRRRSVSSRSTCLVAQSNRCSPGGPLYSLWQTLQSKWHRGSKHDMLRPRLRDVPGLRPSQAPPQSPTRANVNKVSCLGLWR